VDSPDLNIHTWWYSLNDSNSFIFTSNGSIDQIEWDSFSDGTIKLIFYANDTAGNIGFEIINIIKETIVPIININSPNPNDVFGFTAPAFNVDSTDLDIDTMWYSLNDGKDITFTSNSSVDQTEWYSLSDGIIKLKFYANDTAGNIGFEIVNIIKDTIAPTININFPNPNDAYGSEAPAFNVDIPDLDIHTMWYSLNDGKDISFISDGLVDQTEWDSLSDGMIKLTFCANDTLGNINSKNVDVIKDTIAPTININSPDPNETFGSEAPAFNVDSFDLNFHSQWYSLNDGKNITFSSNSLVDQTEWDSLSDGMIKLTFYANDTAGNIVSISIDIIKYDAASNGRNQISSIPILIFIPIITLTLIFSIQFIRKKVDFQ